jgi:hypothetical protein
MTSVEAIEEEAKMEHTYPTLRLLRGGKGPPSDDGPKENWMKDLEVGTVFSCRKKGQSENYALMMLQLCFKHDKTYIIADSLNSNPYAAIDPIEFCKRHDFFELIEKGKTPQEIEDGNDLRSIRHSGMEDDADAEGGQPSDDGSGSK